MNIDTYDKEFQTTLFPSIYRILEVSNAFAPFDFCLSLAQNTRIFTPIIYEQVWNILSLFSRELPHLNNFQNHCMVQTMFYRQCKHLFTSFFMSLYFMFYQGPIIALLVCIFGMFSV